MTQPTNKLQQFWQELKRRKVFRVVAMYAGSAYIIIELVNNISEPLHLPEWTATVIILLLIIGFPIVAILSWIFDITPEGVQKTESIEAAKEQEQSSEPVRRKLRVSDVIIVALIVVVGILVYPKIFMKDKFRSIREADGRISIAVMPFENLTGDSTMNWLQRGISSLIINGLGNSAELLVFDDHIMFEALESMDHIFTAGISLNKGKEVAERVKSETYISGSYQGRMGKYWILLNLIDTESGAITWTKKVEGDLRSPEYLDLADSLCNDVKNHLEIQVLKKEAAYDFKEAYPSSAEAYQYFIKGTNMILTRDYLPAVEYFKKALKIDSTFTFASFYIAYAYCFTTPAQMGQAKIWTQKAYKTRENLPLRFQNWLSLWHACFISKSLPDISLYCNLLEKSAIESRLLWFDLGVTYFSFLKKYEKAVETFERIENICLERNSNWKYEDYYLWYGKALHYAGNHVKEKEIFELGLSLCSDQAYQREIFLNQTICGISEADTTITKKYLNNYIVQLKEIGQAADELEASIGLVYYEANKMVQAEEYLRKALSMNPKYPYYPFLLGRTLINGNINVNEGLELIQKVFEIHPNWWPVYQWKGIGLYKMGEYEASLEYLKKSEELVNTFKYDIYQYIKMAEQAIDNESQ